MNLTSKQKILDQLQQAAFVNNVKAIMELKGVERLTKEALLALGMTNRRFYKILGNREQPTGPELYRLSILFQCDIKQLYSTNEIDDI